MEHAELREQIATATRILVRERMIGPFGHPSARIPDTDLVACPDDPAVVQLFIFDVNAAKIRQVGDWALLRVPRP